MILAHSVIFEYQPDNYSNFTINNKRDAATLLSSPSERRGEEN